MINWDLIDRYAPRMIDGLTVTLQLSFGSVLLGLLIAVPLAIVRVGGPAPLNGAVVAYTYVMRGTPLLAQIFLVYYGSGEFRPYLEAAGVWWLFRDPYYCTLLTLTLNTAAYQTEIFRGAIEAVPHGQREAARAMAMSPSLTFVRVTIPQASRYALRPFGNEVILTLKGSALASVVTVFDLMGATRLAFQRTFDFQAYVIAAIIYIALVEIFRRIWNRVERRLSRHLPDHSARGEAFA